MTMSVEKAVLRARDIVQSRDDPDSLLPVAMTGELQVLRCIPAGVLDLIEAIVTKHGSWALVGDLRRAAMCSPVSCVDVPCCDEPPPPPPRKRENGPPPAGEACPVRKPPKEAYRGA